MEDNLEGSDETEESPKYFRDFKAILEKRPKNVAIFTHSCPDPDALGSQMALEWILKKHNIDSVGFFDGNISHPQNKSMANLLQPNLYPVSSYAPSDFDACFLVDTIPANAGVFDHKVNFDLVIDHHRDVPNGGFNGLFINLKAGSCCGTIYHLIKKLGLEFQHGDDNDSIVATAIMVGISTDTESLMSEDTTNYEFEAWSDLFEFRDVNFLKKIIHWEKPKLWIDLEAEAVKNAVVHEGLGIVGLGIIPGKQRDMIADMADQMVGWEDINTAIAFAVIDGERLEGSVRSRNASVMVSDLCKSLAGKHGNGGGKLGKGAYRYSLAGSSIEEEDDEETKQSFWETMNLKEVKRIGRILRT